MIISPVIDYWQFGGERHCPNAGSGCFCTGACRKSPLERQALQRDIDYYRDIFSRPKPRVRVKAGREVTP